MRVHVRALIPHVHLRTHLRLTEQSSIGVEPRVARLAGVQRGGIVQREPRPLECTVCGQYRQCFRRHNRAHGLHQARRVRQLGGDAAKGLPDVELIVRGTDCDTVHCDTIHVDSHALAEHTDSEHTHAKVFQIP